MKTAPRHRPMKAGKAGFTLLEVMISVSIIAMVLVSLFKMQSGSISLAQTGRFNTLAPLLAKQVLAKMDKDMIDRSGGEGDFGEDFPGIRWTCDIFDIPLKELEMDQTTCLLKKITLRIHGSSGQISGQTYEVVTWQVIFD